MRKEMSKRSKFYAPHLGGGRGMWRMVKYNYIVIFLAAISMLYSCDTIENGQEETYHDLFYQGGKVGWAVIDTTAVGKLSVTAHLDDGEPNKDFSVKVSIYSDEKYENRLGPEKEGILSTDPQGEGDAYVQVDLPQTIPAKAIYVKVVVRNSSWQCTCKVKVLIE